MKNKYYLVPFFFLIFNYSCVDDKSKDKEYWMTGFYEGTFILSKVAIYEDSTFSIEIINGLDDKMIDGNWLVSNDSLYLMADTSNRNAVILLGKEPHFLIEESDSIFNDRLFREIHLRYIK